MFVFLHEFFNCQNTSQNTRVRPVDSELLFISSIWLYYRHFSAFFEELQLDIYSHELCSYKLEIENIRDELNKFKDESSEAKNFTHFGLGISNRGHFIVIGLCSLVEIYLYDLVRIEEEQQLFKFSDLSGQGTSKLQKYLSKTGRVDFGKLKHWSAFKNIYTIRNTFVHSYGGLMETQQLEQAKSSLKNLQMESSLVGNRRIRLSYDYLVIIHGHIESLISELKIQA